MKLLFDQNISFRVVKQFQSSFPEFKQVRQLGLENSSDREIWNFARKNEFSIVTFDADFFDLLTLLGHPPKIVWLRLGNASSARLTDVLMNNIEVIKSFISEDRFQEIGCLEIAI